MTSRAVYSAYSIMYNVPADRRSPVSGDQAEADMRNDKSAGSTPMNDDLPPLPRAVLKLLQAHPGREFSRREVGRRLPPRLRHLVTDAESGLITLSLTLGVLRMQGYPIPEGRCMLTGPEDTGDAEDRPAQRGVRGIPEHKLQPVADAILEILDARRGERIFAKDVIELLPAEMLPILGHGAARLPRISNAVSLLRRQGHPIPKGRYVLPGRP